MKKQNELDTTTATATATANELDAAIRAAKLDATIAAQIRMLAVYDIAAALTYCRDRAKETTTKK